MRAYYFDNLPGDQRLPHDYVPSRPVSTTKLESLGVKYWNIPVEGHEAKLNAVANERGYKNRDQINVSKEGMGEVSLLCNHSQHNPERGMGRFTSRRSRPSLRSTCDLQPYKRMTERDEGICMRMRKSDTFSQAADSSTCVVRIYSKNHQDMTKQPTSRNSH